MIFFGFFACGYQLAFLTAHFPAMVTEMCSEISPTSALHFIGVSTTSGLGALAIALIAFSNIFGTIYAGWLGQKFPKKSNEHMALTDIRESLKELVFYRQHYFIGREENIIQPVI